MPPQFSVAYDPGFTIFGLIFDPAERAWNGTAFVDPTGVRPACAVAMVYDAPSGTYIGDVPSSVPVGPTGTYTVRSYLQLGGSPDDQDPVVGVGTVTVTAAVAPRVSTDKDFLAGMIHSVAVEYDVKSSGAVVGRRGSSGDAVWEPVAGLEAVACRIVLTQSLLTEGAARPGESVDGRVLFGREIAADRRNRLVYQDPTFGTRYFYPLGKVRDAHQMGHHWVVEISEVKTA